MFQNSFLIKEALLRIKPLVTLALLVEEGNSFIYFEGAYQIEMLQEMSRTKSAQAQESTRFKLQSAPNLHRDKKSFELQSAPNLHRDKKKVLNFKVHQTCTGTNNNKKNNNFPGILAPSQADCKVFVLFVFLTL